MKRCTKCGHEKRLELFNRDASRKDGLKDWCRSCQQRLQRDAYDGNQEIVNDRRRNAYKLGKGRGNKSARYRAMKALQERRLAVVQAYRNAKGCERCGEKHPGVLDLHHRDPEQKHPRLVRKANGRLKHSNGWRDLSYADISAELEKCEVLCSNCHRKEEWQRRYDQAPPEIMVLVA